ncbi:MAG TPA: hypothetical protein VMT20_19620 [Terriglobia bacterium]|nr:hypothetical protein [Terriglobia bacterium]
MNRKEVFFTATVLPAIICADRFKHFHRFLNLLGLPDVPIDVSREKANIQLFTEYCLAESIHHDPRFPGAPRDPERPDLVIFIEGSPPRLIAVEAKLYNRTQPSDLKREMERQEMHVLKYLRERWPGLQTTHTALLPEAMKAYFGDQGPTRTITWEEIIREYQDLESARYFLEILRIALEEYQELKGSEITFGANAEDKLTGADILDRHQHGDTEFQAMGRHGGINGAALKADVADGRWQRQVYEVRSSPINLPATNWFPISDFVALVSRNLSFITAFGAVLNAARGEESDDAAFGRRVRQIIMEQCGADALTAQ